MVPANGISSDSNSTMFHPLASHNISYIMHGCSRVAVLVQFLDFGVVLLHVGEQPEVSKAGVGRQGLDQAGDWFEKFGVEVVN